MNEGNARKKRLTLCLTFDEETVQRLKRRNPEKELRDIVLESLDHGMSSLFGEKKVDNIT